MLGALQCFCQWPKGFPEGIADRFCARAQGDVSLLVEPATEGPTSKYPALARASHPTKGFVLLFPLAVFLLTGVDWGIDSKPISVLFRLEIQKQQGVFLRRWS